MIEDSVRYLKEQGKEVVYDAEHFYDGYLDNPEYALSTLEAAERGGADFLVLCETNGGKLVPQVEKITGTVVTRFPSTRVGVHCHNDIDCVETAKNGDTVVAYVNDEATLKEYHRTKERIELHPKNTAFDIINIDESDDFRIGGIVLGVIRKY